MEESGRLRRGYFVAGLGATQFALPGALDLLRSLKGPTASDLEDEERAVVLASSDPANPYGATLKWPSHPLLDARRGPTRTVGTTVVLLKGGLVAYLTRGDRQLLTWLPAAEPLRSHAAQRIARVLIERARSGGEEPRGMLIEEIDGHSALVHAMGPFLIEAGFAAGALGFAPVPEALTARAAADT